MLASPALFSPYARSPHPIRRPSLRLLTALLVLAPACEKEEQPSPDASRADCELPVCASPCACDLTTACDEACEGCDPECGDCREASLACESPDAGPTVPDCREAIPPGRTLSETCCPGHGRDACGALLFCAALDGRDEPTCYPERSRPDQTECPADYACVSGACNPELGLCKSSAGSTCTAEVGCATSPTGRKTFCDTTASPVFCREVGDGTPGAACAEAGDCESSLCEGFRCRARPGDPCFFSNQCIPGQGCYTCSYGLCGEGGGSHCVSSCEGYRCPVGDPPRPCEYNPEARAPSCPLATPTSVSCPVVAYGSSTIDVEVTWASSIADMYRVRCHDDVGNLIDFQLSEGTATSARLTLYIVRRGQRYTCGVQVMQLVYASDDYSYWLVGPEGASCTVTAP